MKTHPTRTQYRLMDRLVAAIYATAEALYITIQAVTKNRNRSWTDNDRLAARFWALYRDLIALPIRTTPNILSPNPAFRASPRPDLMAPRQQAVTRQPRAYPCRTPYTARQLAQRLLDILQKMIALAAEALATLTPEFYHQAAKAKALAGCHALPPKSPTWERAG